VLLDALSDAQWARLAADAPGASIFHDPQWAALLHRQYRYPVTVCGLADADGRLVAGLPIAEVRSRLTGRRLVALPFSDACPPLLAGDAPLGAAQALADALDVLRRRRGLPLEVRGGERLPGTLPGARFHRHVVPLEPDLDAVTGRFRRAQVLRGVRRALREGLTIEQRTDAPALAAFYRLHALTRARQGVPTQPRRFIMRFADLFAARLGFVLLVRSGRAPLAAAVFLRHGDTLTYKYGASDPRALRVRPNNLLFMEAIRWACANGVRELDLGRTDLGQDGLRAFKLAWGAVESELRYRIFTDEPSLPRAGRSTRALGAVLRRSPPLASRIAGEALYRHAG
jgi:CelD/BcsL family acetyltransferase involved in cellulose biosynthesis